MRLHPFGVGSRWRFVHHLRKKHSIWRFFTVVPGISPLSRLQLITTFFNQLLLSFSLTMMWYGQPRCFIEESAIAGLFSFFVSLTGSSLGRWLLSIANRSSWDKKTTANRKM